MRLIIASSLLAFLVAGSSAFGQQAALPVPDPVAVPSPSTPATFFLISYCAGLKALHRADGWF